MGLASRVFTRANTDGNGTDREERRNGAASIGNRTSVTAPALSTAEAPLPSSVCQAARRRLERPCLSPPSDNDRVSRALSALAEKRGRAETAGRAMHRDMR